MAQSEALTDIAEELRILAMDGGALDSHDRAVLSVAADEIVALQDAPKTIVNTYVYPAWWRVTWSYGNG